MRIIGIDCATADKNVGLALAEYEAGRLLVRKAEPGNRRDRPVVTISGWIREAAGPVLLALDAPLGWPEPMGRTLVSHNAGEPVEVGPNKLVRRETDRYIKAKLRKTPLDVGADKIARTAHAALSLLQELRDQLGLPIPLAWGPQLVGVSAIEVYPAATLIAHGFRSMGYKRPEQTKERRELLASLTDFIDIGACGNSAEGDADVLDAAICTLAGLDFLAGQAMQPENLALAQREGWIWAAVPREPWD